MDEFTDEESKGGALTENRVRSGTRHGGAAGAQEQGFYHRRGDAAMLAPTPTPTSQDSWNWLGKGPQGSRHSSLPEVWPISPRICV